MIEMNSSDVFHSCQTNLKRSQQVTQKQEEKSTTKGNQIPKRI